MKQQLDLFKEEPKYCEYVDEYLDRNRVDTNTIVYLFKKHCGQTGVYNPVEPNRQDRIMRDLENYGGLGTMEDYLIRKYVYKHIVNMYHYVNDELSAIQPIQDWIYQISI